jgi:hypothetical protein
VKIREISVKGFGKNERNLVSKRHQLPIATCRFSVTLNIPFRPKDEGEQRFISHRVDAVCVLKGAQADHNNIKINPVFRGMLRENHVVLTKGKLC